MIRKAIRKAIVAGSFYPSDQAQLNKMLEKTFLGKFGPGMLPKGKAERKCDDAGKGKGADTGEASIVIVPHAGYIYSGQCAAHAYAALKNADCFVILGTNHSGYGNADFLLSHEDFETPLGIVKNDIELGEVLLQKCKEKNIDTAFDDAAHGLEHSIEVQLPFLQFIYKTKTLRILPVIVNRHNLNRHNKRSCEIFKMFARCIIEAAKKIRRSICFIASSDFTHYGAAYGFLPFPPQEARKKLYQLDKKAIDAILDLDTERFLEIAQSTTICGAGAIAIAIEAAKILKRKGKLLSYYTSADIVGNYSTAVGYAAISFS